MDGSVMNLRPANRLKRREVARVEDFDPNHDAALDAFFGVKNFRQQLPLPAPLLERIDRIISEHGLRALLSGITHLCYERAKGGDEETFDDLADTEQWARAARVVEIATINDRVNLK